MKYDNKKIIEKNKKNIIKKLFNDVSQKYDLMNDVMSFGLHRIWKRDLIKLAKRERANIILDLAGGTGDISNSLAKTLKNSLVVLYDLSYEMINYGKNKKKNRKNLLFVNGSADQLAIKNNSVDLITIVFGLRNFADKDKCIKECWRVLFKNQDVSGGGSEVASRKVNRNTKMSIVFDGFRGARGGVLGLSSFQTWARPVLVAPHRGSVLAQNHPDQNMLALPARRPHRSIPS